MSRAFTRGLADSLSIGLGYVPVAISFGLAAVQAGMTPLVALTVSLLIYAGASQFILVSLLAAGSAAPAMVAIITLMNLRHLFYGPALLGRFGPAPLRRPLALLAAGLTDEVFATSASKMDRLPPDQRESWYLGLQLGAYMAWVGGTALGAYVGHDWIQDSPLIARSLGFVLPALFFALLLEIRSLVSMEVLAAATIATLASLLFLPAYGAMIAGMLTGAAWAVRRR